LKNDPVDVVELLGRAVEMVPIGAVNEAGAIAADAYEYLDHNEWEVALNLEGYSQAIL
jgi:hypothetical protein